MFRRADIQDSRVSSILGSLAFVGHSFPRFTWHSSTNWVLQSTDVLSAILFIINTSKGLTQVLHIIIMTSLKNSNKTNIKRGNAEEIMIIKLKLQIVEKWLKSRKSFLCVWFISWVVDYIYNLVGITKMFILNFIHRF